ncbi:hypothetical protein DOE51_02190 [Bdellovibrio sp. NC01]|nr:hypothetical protein DOE51_02190 [Bdellovibrio sp. NC01]
MFCIFVVAICVNAKAQSQTQEPAQTPAKATKTSAKPKRVPKILNFSLGVGYPGNALEAPSKHLSISLDLWDAGNWKWGPYFAYFLADGKETVNFPSTGYTEVRHSRINSYALGAQGRLRLRPRYNLITALGLSYASQEITSVDTTAPIPSSSVGYKKEFPVGLYGKAGVQYTVTRKNWAYGAELGFEITNMTNSNESFSAGYLSALIRYGF